MNKRGDAAAATWICRRNPRFRPIRSSSRRIERRPTRRRYAGLARSFNAWVEDVSERKRLRGIVLRAVHRMTHGQVAVGWRTWSRFAVAARIMDLAGDVAARRVALMRVCRFCRLNLAHTFSFWRRVAQAEATAELRGEVVASSATLSSLKNREAAERERRALRMWTGGILGTCYTTWKDNVKREKRERVILKRFRKRLDRQVLQAQFNSWDRYRMDRRALRKVVKKVLYVSTSGMLLSGLKLWKEAVHGAADAEAKERQTKLILDRVKRKWLNKSLHQSWEAWRHYLACRLRLKTLANRVIKRFAHNTVAPGFEAWRAAMVSRRRRFYLVAASPRLSSPRDYGVGASVAPSFLRGVGARVRSYAASARAWRPRSYELLAREWHTRPYAALAREFRPRRRAVEARRRRASAGPRAPRGQRHRARDGAHAESLRRVVVRDVGHVLGGTPADAISDKSRRRQVSAPESRAGVPVVVALFDGLGPAAGGVKTPGGHFR